MIHKDQLGFIQRGLPNAQCFILIFISQVMNGKANHDHATENGSVNTQILTAIIKLCCMNQTWNVHCDFGYVLWVRRA